MYSTLSKLDRDVARSFLNPISYLPIPMRTQYIDNTKSVSKENYFPKTHPNAQLGFPTNTNINPMYYDVIIDTVTDYDSE